MRNTIILGSAALAASSLAGCHHPATVAAAPSVNMIQTSEAIQADVHQLVTDFNAHDAARAVSHDGSGYVGMFHGMPNVVGAAADLAVTKQQIADPAAKVEISNENIDIAKAGDMAVFRATYTFTYTDPKTKAPATEHGNWVLGYKPQSDGSWKLAWSVVSDTGPQAAPKT